MKLAEGNPHLESLARPGRLLDPFEFKDVFWPHVYFYSKQRKIIRSVNRDDETYVPAGNMLGKDFVSGFIALYFFLSRFPCRIVTTSVREDHLDVLWGEIREFIDTSRYALLKEDGGPLILSHLDIRRWLWKRDANGEIVGEGKKAPKCYIVGRVAGPKAEGLSGHHIPDIGDGIPRTLLMEDEASGCDDEVHKKGSAWMRRFLAIGNCWKCENHFKHAVKGKPGTKDKGGDIPRDPDDLSKGYHRRVITIKATDSPNVQRQLNRIKKGLAPDNKMLVPGVLSWELYQTRRKLWDKERQAIGLDAQFYDGQTQYLFPTEWLDLAQIIASKFQSKIQRRARGIGVDCAEGGDNTALCAVDEDGIIDLQSCKTPDTSEIPDLVIDFMKKHKCPAENVIFDRGGGGYEHVCLLQKLGFNVRTLSFGEPAGMESKDKWKYYHTRKEKRIEAEEKTIYKNRRAELYGDMRDILNPAYETGFGIDARFTDIFEQFAPIPLWWEEGKLVLPPKHPKPDAKNPEEKITLIKLIGRSPDEADSLCLAVYAMTHKPLVTVLRSIA